MIIDLVLKGNTAVQDGLSDLADALRDLDRNLGQLATNLGKVGTTSSQSAKNLNAQATAGQKATGVMSKLIKAQKDYNDAIKSGNATQITDAHDKLLKAQAAHANYLKRTRPKRQSNPVADWLGQLIGTTRVNLGHASPLVNKLVPGGQKAISGGLNQMMGGGASKMGNIAPAAGDAAMGAEAGEAAAALGAIVAPIAIAIAAIALLAKAASDAKDALLGLQAVKWQTNATGGELGGAQGLAAGLGMQPGDLGGMARSFNDAIGNGGFAQVAAGKAGISSAHNAWDRSTQDDMKNLLQAAKYIASASKEDAVRFAHLTGTEKLLGLRDLSPDTQQRVLHGMGAIKQEDITAAADFQANLGLISADFQRIEIAIGGPILKGAAVAFGEIADALALIPKVNDKISEGIDDLWRKVMDFLHPDGGKRDKAAEADKKLKAAKEAQDKKDEATRKNTDALNDNTRTLQDARQIFGGGPKARKAVPAAWRWQNADQMAYSTANRLGAF